MNAAAMNADPPIRANAPANPAAPDASQVTKLKLAGFNIEPASAISRFTPKNLPRASGGATSAPSVASIPPSATPLDPP